jgi:hypothetical protein
MATDLAEVVGGAIALNMLFGLPLFVGGLVTGLVSFALLALQTHGDRRFIVAVTCLFAAIVLGFVLLVLRVPVDPGAAFAGLVPRFDGTGSVLLATGILGATVMPLWSRRAPAPGRSGSVVQPSAPSAPTCCPPWGWPGSSTPRCSSSLLPCSTGPASSTSAR